MIEKTKQLVESKYTVENSYSANAKVRGLLPAHCWPETGLGLVWEVQGPPASPQPSGSHVPLPRWCMVTLTLSCADLASPLWLRPWPWDGRLRTGCLATSPRPSG